MTTLKTIQNHEDMLKYPKISGIVRTRTIASERIRMHPNVSKHVQMSPNLSFREPAKLSKILPKSAKSLKSLSQTTSNRHQKFVQFFSSHLHPTLRWTPNGCLAIRPNGRTAFWPFVYFRFVSFCFVSFRFVLCRKLLRIAFNGN